MKKLACLITTATSLLAFSAPAFAQQVPLTTIISCGTNQEIILDDNTDTELADNPVTCDLAIKKEVSINGVDFFDANDASSAVESNFGATVTFRVTVTDVTASPYVITGGNIVVGDVFPDSLSVLSSTASNGSFAKNVWTYGYVPTASLIIQAKVLSTGTIANTAVLNTETDQESNFCDGPCPADTFNGNNFDSAYIAVNRPPQVLGASTSTLADTGSALFLQTLAAAKIIALAINTATKKRPVASQPINEVKTRLHSRKKQ